MYFDSKRLLDSFLWPLPSFWCQLRGSNLAQFPAVDLKSTPLTTPANWRLISFASSTHYILHAHNIIMWQMSQNIRFFIGSRKLKKQSFWTLFPIADFAVCGKFPRRIFFVASSGQSMCRHCRLFRELKQKPYTKITFRQCHSMVRQNVVWPCVGFEVWASRLEFLLFGAL